MGERGGEEARLPKKETADTELKSDGLEIRLIHNIVARRKGVETVVLRINTRTDVSDEETHYCTQYVYIIEWC